MVTPITKTPAEKTPAKKVGILQTIKNKIIDKTSDVMALPATMRANRIQRNATADVKAMKAGRAIRGKPIEPADSSNPDFRTAVNAVQAEFNVKNKVGYR